MILWDHFVFEVMAQGERKKPQWEMPREVRAGSRQRDGRNRVRESTAKSMLPNP